MWGLLTVFVSYRTIFLLLFKIIHILVLATNSGRVDHVMGNLETLHTAQYFLKKTPVILMSSNSLTWLLHSGIHHIISVPQEFVCNHHSVGLIPLLGPTKVSTSGLKWDLGKLLNQDLCNI